MNTIAVKRFVTSDFQVSEAFKTLRTNLVFSGPSVQTVVLTSFGSSEGKSTISFQLAVSLAEAGKRVLLVDADLRKSVLLNRLRVKEKVIGLSHYLSGLSEIDDMLYKTDVPDFFVMFAGARVPNSAELLGGEKFQNMIGTLKDAFDYIIIDAAPLGLVIDAAVMASAADGVVMVVDATHNSYKLVRKIKNQLEKAGGKVLGVVLNRVDFKDNGGYYGKSYGYGYGYGEEQ